MHPQEQVPRTDSGANSPAPKGRWSRAVQKISEAFDARSVLFSVLLMAGAWAVSKVIFEFPNEEAFLVSCLALIFKELAKFRLDYASLRDAIAEDKEFRAEQMKLLPVFSRMSKDLALIASAKHGPKDLFHSHLSEEVRRLQSRLNLAAEKSELTISSDYVINVEGVFESFNLCEEKILRLTYCLDRGSSLLGNEADIRFLEVALEFLRDKRFNGMRVLFVISKGVEEDAMFIKLWGYLHSRGVVNRYVYSPTFVQLCVQNNVAANDVEFGIYGPEMLFIAHGSELGMNGLYIRNPDIVARYRRLFDQCWDSEGLSSVIEPATGGPPSSLSDLKRLSIGERSE